MKGFPPKSEFTSDAHFHADEAGALQRCYHRCRTSVSSPGFWIGLTVGFPFEHLLWTKVFPFSWITKLLGIPV